ncbi:MAG: tetratricopeptide repeat protein [Cyclobacteriaceae bacterium]
MRTAYFLALLFVLPFSLVAQNTQGEYLEAKRLFSQGQYTSAKGSFGALTEDPYFGSYASFYYALSSYHQGDVRLAVDMWTQMLSKYPEWSNKNEVYFWLAYANLEKGNYDAGITNGQKLSKGTKSPDLERQMYEMFLASLGVDTLRQLYQRHDTNKNLALIFGRRLMMQPYEERDFDLINRLNAKWNFDEGNFRLEELPEIKKDKYDVAVMLPFMYDQQNLESVIQNDLVMELYQGMLFASNDLKQRGININLIPVDTRRSAETTDQWLQSVSPAAVDLIVGPLYPGPVSAAKVFSQINKINMINPLSSNSDVISGNQYAFLFEPTYETMATRLAEYADTTFTGNRNAMVFYEDNLRDSIFAGTYKQKIEEAGFNVVWFQSLTKENAKGVLDTLIAEYETYYTKEEADSITELNLPKRYVKERRVRKDELDRLRKCKDGKAEWDSLYYLPVSYNDEGKGVTYYENFLYIKPDSVSHILGATRKNYLANNLISAVETMGDSTELFGFGEWLDFTMLSFSQLQRIGVSMVYPGYIDRPDSSVLLLENRIKRAYKTMPSKYHLQGYELVMQFGSLMGQHGVYFQNGIRSGQYLKGEVFQGMKFGSANDNQVVPVVKFENAELEIVNKESYEY